VAGNVTAPAQTPYEQWIDAYPSLTGNATDGGADPDQDGYVNDTEFAFDGDPTVPTAALLSNAVVGGNMTIRFVARKTDPAGATYQVEAADDLVTGFTGDPSVVVGTSADQSGILLPDQYERREFTVPLDGGMRFYRVKAAVGE
jgi:hypothetical protein